MQDNLKCSQQEEIIKAQVPSPVPGKAEGLTSTRLSEPEEWRRQSTNCRDNAEPGRTTGYHLPENPKLSSEMQKMQTFIKNPNFISEDHCIREMLDSFLK